MKYVLDEQNPREESFLNYDADTYEYKGREFSAKMVTERFVKSDGLDFKTKCGLIVKALDNNFILTPRSVKALYRAEHAGKVSKFFDDYKIKGDLKCHTEVIPATLKVLEDAFKADPRFHGRVPQIAPSIAAAADFYGIETDVLVNNFTVAGVRPLIQAGCSGVEATLLYSQLDGTHLSQIVEKPTLGYLVAKLLEKSILAKKENERGRYRNAALWVCEHTSTDFKLIKKVAKKAADIHIERNSSIDYVNTQLSGLKSLSEVERIEKRYKDCNFKFKNCECNLKFSESEYGRYRAEILHADDTRQVMLGQNTNCCQYLDGIGESAMMHGLLNPKAGFWLLTNKNSGKVLAQAEIWEENEDTIVFDNIEFANDADINLYRKAIGKWLEESPYQNAKMGAGYNQLTHVATQLRGCGHVNPTVTPYEIYVISHEEESECDIVFDSVREAREALASGRVTWFDYVYSDIDQDPRYPHEDPNRGFWMKENGTVEPYFAAAEREGDHATPHDRDDVEEER